MLKTINLRIIKKLAIFAILLIGTLVVVSAKNSSPPCTLFCKNQVLRPCLTTCQLLDRDGYNACVEECNLAYDDCVEGCSNPN